MERLDRRFLARDKSENFIGPPVPLDGVQLLVLEVEGAVEHGIVTPLDRLRDVHS